MAGRLRAQVEARAPRKTSEPTADQERDKPVTKAKVGQRSGAERGLGGEWNVKTSHSSTHSVLKQTRQAHRPRLIQNTRQDPQKCPSKPWKCCSLRYLWRYEGSEIRTDQYTGTRLSADIDIVSASITANKKKCKSRRRNGRNMREPCYRCWCCIICPVEGALLLLLLQASTA